MKTNAVNLLRAMLWLICFVHVTIGAGVNLVPGFAPLMAGIYGAEVNWSPEFTYIIKPLGAFMFALGVICIAAALQPLKHRMIIYGFATLFVLRALQRLLFAREIADTFGIGTGRNIVNMTFFLVLAAVLIILERTASRESVESTKNS